MYRSPRLQVVTKSVEPVYGEDFYFRAPWSELSSVPLSITVWDHDKLSRDDCIGRGEIALAELDLQGGKLCKAAVMLQARATRGAPPRTLLPTLIPATVWSHSQPSPHILHSLVRCRTGARHPAAPMPPLNGCRLSQSLSQKQSRCQSPQQSPRRRTWSRRRKLKYTGICTPLTYMESPTAPHDGAEMHQRGKKRRHRQ